MAEASIGAGGDIRPRVLYIQQQDAERGRVAATLRQSGFEVVEANSGISGLEAARSCHPDLLLVDLHLPDLDGGEVATRLRRLGMEGLPIVALGAPGAERGMALTAGCDGTITSPPDLNKLPSQLREFLAGKRDKLRSTDEKKYLKEYNQFLVEKLEGKVRELTTAHERQKRIDAFKNEFMHSISHELSTPLTPLIGYLKILAGEKLGPLNEKQKKVVESIIQSAERLTRSVDNLADFAVLETGDYRVRKSPLNLVQVVEHLVEGLHEVAKPKRVQIRTTIQDRELTVQGDETRLAQAIAHLLDNAVKYSPHGGFVLVDLKRVDKKAQLAVLDQGAGVSAEEQPKIFEAFSHSKGARHIAVAGLGLPVAKKIVEAHGGTISVESPPLVQPDPGHQYTGARFLIELPI